MIQNLISLLPEDKQRALVDGDLKIQNNLSYADFQKIKEADLDFQRHMLVG